MGLKFWKKKEDDLFIDDDLKKPIEGVDKSFAHSEPSQGLDDLSGQPHRPNFPTPSQDFVVREKPQQQFQPSHGNDELILAKLDAIKAMVENLSRRLERIEQIALEEERKRY